MRTQGSKLQYCRPINFKWAIEGTISSVQTTILIEKGPFWQNRDQIGTKNGQMVPIGTLPKNRDRLDAHVNMYKFTWQKLASRWARLELLS